jgi:calcium/calmodulin-dependent protein kinase I
MDMLLLKYFSRPDITNLLICGHWGKMTVVKADSRVITYTLLCGYSPFRSEDRDELIEETVRARVVCI